MLGPEVENIGPDSDLGGANTMTSYANTLKGKTGLAGYAYHLYNSAEMPTNEKHFRSSLQRTAFALRKQT
jgi:hypothetical protein